MYFTYNQITNVKAFNKGKWVKLGWIKLETNPVSEMRLERMKKSKTVSNDHGQFALKFS